MGSRTEKVQGERRAVRFLGKRTGLGMEGFVFNREAGLLQEMDTCEGCKTEVKQCLNWGQESLGLCCSVTWKVAARF